MTALSTMFPASTGGGGSGDTAGGMTIGDRITYSTSQTVSVSTWSALSPSSMELAGVIAVIIGGGGGGAVPTYTGDIGGWGGERVREYYPVEELGSSVVLTIGAGGTAGSDLSNPTSGGDTSFGSLRIAYGGPGGGRSGKIDMRRQAAPYLNGLWLWGAGGNGSYASGWGSHGDYGGGGGTQNGYGGVVRTRAVTSAATPSYSSSWGWGVSISSIGTGTPASLTAGTAGHAGIGDYPGGGGNGHPSGTGGAGGFPGGGGGAGSTLGGAGGAGVVYVYPVFRKVLP